MSSNPWKIACLIPDLPEPADILPYLMAMHQARWYSNFGPLVTRFEEEMARFLYPEAPAAIKVLALSSATAGLELMLRYAGLKPGARVLVPAVTFAATALTVMAAGLVPVIADVDPETWDLTPAIARAALEMTSYDAVLTVAAFGYPIDTKAWQAFQDETAIRVFGDAAASLGQQPVSPSMPYVFSLHATKPFGVGEGGLLVSGDHDFVDHVRRQANFGFVDGSVIEAGTNAKMAEYFAGVGMAQKARFEKIRARRAEVYGRYCQGFQGSDIALRPAAAGIYPATFPVDTKGRAAHFEAKLKAAAIQTRRWYLPPLHHHKAFADCPRVAAHLPVSEALDKSLLGLPFHGFLSNDDIALIINYLIS